MEKPGVGSLQAAGLTPQEVFEAKAKKKEAGAFEGPRGKVSSRKGVGANASRKKERYCAPRHVCIRSSSPSDPNSNSNNKYAYPPSNSAEWESRYVRETEQQQSSSSSSGIVSSPVRMAEQSGTSGMSVSGAGTGSGTGDRLTEQSVRESNAHEKYFLGNYDLERRDKERAHAAALAEAAAEAERLSPFTGSPLPSTSNRRMSSAFAHLLGLGLGCHVEGIATHGVPVCLESALLLVRELLSSHHHQLLTLTEAATRHVEPSVEPLDGYVVPAVPMSAL